MASEQEIIEEELVYGALRRERLWQRLGLTGPATLRLTLTATSDQPTLMNLANHSYWNLDGTDHTGDHRLQISADHYLPTDADGLPLTPTPVAGPKNGSL